MEQIKELLEILKETPQMALWGIGLYFMFILIKAASWIGALTLVAKQFIKRYFDHKRERTILEEKSLNTKRGFEIAEYFEKHKISSVDYNLFIKLIDTIRDHSTYTYIHESNLLEAIKAIEKYKEDKK